MLLCAVAGMAAQPTTHSPAQSPVQASTQSAGATAGSNDKAESELASGTTICVTLSKTIDAKKAKAGDAIMAHVTLPVLARGKVLLPNDTKITGHVVSAKKRSRDEGQSQLAIVFDRAVLKDGSVVPLALTVQAIGMSAFSAAELARDDNSDGNPFGGAARQPATMPTTRQPTMLPPPTAREVPTPRSPGSDAPGAQHPALDTGSHGAVGLPNLTLTESPNAARGSVVKATKKNVKLESGMEMILRVVAAEKSKGNS
jgi:hypothetical protein